MWRASGASYLRYSTEMASILRDCLKDPLRQKAINANKTHLQEKVWNNGVIAQKARYESAREAFAAEKVAKS